MSFGRRAGMLGDQAIEHGVLGCGAGDVDDDGVPCRALLGGEDAGHGGGVEGVGAEAVDGLRGEGDQAAARRISAARAMDRRVSAASRSARSTARRRVFTFLFSPVKGLLSPGAEGQSHLPYTHWLRWLSRRKSKFG